MSDQDTPVLVGWPIANPHAFDLQGDTPVPHRGQPAGDATVAPAGIQPLPPGAGTSGPVFPVSGIK